MEKNILASAKKFFEIVLCVILIFAIILLIRNGSNRMALKEHGTANTIEKKQNAAVSANTYTI